MPPIKLKLNLAAVAGPSTPIARPAKGRSARDRSEESTPEREPRQSSPYADDALGLRMGSNDDDYSPPPHTSTDPKPTIRLNLSSLPIYSESPSVMSSAASTPMTGTPVSTPGPSEPKRKRGRPKKRPTAIPPHLVTPRTTPRSMATGLSTPMSEMEMQGDDYDVDPLSLPLSPNADISYSPGADSPSYQDGSYVDYTPRQTRWKRVKRPFQELAKGVLAQMARKDSYGFFLEPVNIEDYPDYWDRIGGEDKAMDLGTMQRKLDDGTYTNMDQLETDFRKVIDAAKTFNMPGTMPFREANKVFTHGMKHIDRCRPLVLTPSPSPSPSQSMSALPESTPSTPHPGPTTASGSAPSKSHRGPRLEKDMQPKKRIPSQMLEFPPNSLAAKAIGWNQTGGRRVRAKRFVRGRERFIGKWRDWCLDGSRDLAEMDDPAGILEELVHRNGDYLSGGVDWQRMRQEEDDWWEWDGLGGPTGQPPLPGSDRLKPKPMLRKNMEHLEFGPYPMLKKELDRLHNRTKIGKKEQPLGEFEALETHLRPVEVPAPVPSGYPEQKFENIYKRRKPMEFLYNTVLGGVPGEAYTRSVQRFLDGALEGAAKRRNEEPSEGQTIVRDYVANSWHGGVVQGDLGRIATQTAVAIGNVLPGTTATVKAGTDGSTTVAGVDLSPSAAVAAVDRAYGNIALCDLTAPTNPLNLAPLLRDPSEFLYPGIGGKSGVLPALEWISNEIDKVAREQEAVRAATAAEREAREKQVSNGTVVAAAPTEKTADAMDVDTPAADAVSLVAGVKRSSEDPADEPEAKRSRVSSPVKVETSENAQPNGSVVEPAVVSTPAAPTPQAADVPASQPAAPAPTAATPAVAPVPATTLTTPAVPSTTAPPTVAVQTEADTKADTEAALRQLRLELVAVSKFYPLASLKKMTKDQAKKLLPASVRALMTKPDT